ncbi:hypothetical protein KBD45_03505 [Candidatus Dojkabacteria bacterium]|nr:hypothetical protein [Candidatus Dojkabacteria bacterium]
MATRFYIYFHINPLKNEVFYVGKGSGRRAYKKYDRSELWNNIVNKYGLIVNIIEEGITNKEALELEKFYINKIGRRDLELGPLVNHTDGGENPPIRYGNKNRLGSKQTEEWKKINQIFQKKCG